VSRESTNWHKISKRDLQYAEDNFTNDLDITINQDDHDYQDSDLKQKSLIRCNS
jgi:hypothetical protein